MPHFSRIALVSLLASLSFSAPAFAGGAADDPGRSAAHQVLVGFRPGTSEQERAAAASRAGATRRETVSRGWGASPPVELLHLTGGSSNSKAIETLQSDPAVAYAEPNWLQTAAAVSNDPFYVNGSLWGMYGDATTPSNQYGSQAGEAWLASHTGSRTVYVGVIDEGIQFSHPDLSANVWTNPHDPVDGQDNDANGYVDDEHGWDFASGDRTVYDGGNKGRLDSHGTHVTGTIAASGGNGQGVAGVNWNVTYISGKFLARNGGTTANAIRAVDYFTDLKLRHGVDVVATNNSWGGGGFSQALLDAISRAAGANILFVAAAGNGGGDGKGDNNDTTPSYPSNYNTTTAGYDGVLAVAALTSSGSLASYSNYGPASVDLGAPGSGITSTLPYDKYGSFSGTSMATPHVTGALALYAASHPGVRGSALKAALLAASAPTPSLAGKTATGGRLDASGF